MKRSTTSTLAAAIGLAFATAAFAGATMSKSEHSAAKGSITAGYKSDKAGCDPLAGNGKDICMAEARGREKVALAQLQATYEPSDKARYEVRLAKAEAAYSVATEKCDDRAGNAKDVCRKEAASAQTAAQADAKAQMKTADARGTAAVKSEKAEAKADRQIVEVRKDAAEDKRDAAYAVAKEKCDALAGDPKDLCVKDAKAQYGKS
jgi:hypothetical protein